MVGYWGYTANSSIGQQTLAALKAYGLVELPKARCKLSERGLRILLDKRPDSKERQQALLDAALAPKLFRKAWETWGANPPAVDAIVTDLRLSWDFHDERSAKKFLSLWEATKVYAGLVESGTVITDDEEDVPKEIEPGCLVQWGSKGVDQFVSPRRVRAIQEEDGDQWVFVEGTETGIPASEVTVVDGPPEEPNMPVGPQPQKSPPTLALPVEHADTYLLTLPFNGKSLSVRVHLPGETLSSEHFEKVREHLDLLIEKPKKKS
ncbi:MAG: hypothetical protein IH936_12045 [Acidobacteria bacterium]|nr:hypothetical protein [Acidobacteriota bacterium]